MPENPLTFPSVAAALRARLPAVRAVHLGMKSEQVRALASDHGFSALACRYPSRGGVDRLCELAWLGTVFVDIGMDDTHPERDVVMREAALFNVAIALFDTVIDDGVRDERAVLLEALKPARLLARLENPRAEGSLLYASHPHAHPIVGLFDVALASIAARFHLRTERTLDRLKLTLVAMYESETRDRHDRSQAKALPVMFYGLLPDGGARANVAAVFRQLGELVAWLDDWKDLRDDLLRARANLWICRWDARGPLPIQYAAGALWSLTRLALMPWRVTSLLGAAIDNLLAATEEVHRDKLICCLALLLGTVDT
jgi:hypothetical protein